jgi:hypothetical protein
VSKVRERLAVNKKISQKFHMEMFSFNKLNEVEGKEQNRVEVLENMDAEIDIISASKTIRERINISAKDSLENGGTISHGLTRDAQNY